MTRGAGLPGRLPGSSASERFGQQENRAAKSPDSVKAARKEVWPGKARQIRDRRRNEKMIGIISAMDLEIEKLVEAMSDVETRRYAGVDYYAGSYAGKEVAVCNCGVGKVNAAMHTQILIERYRPSVIIQNGIAGSLAPEVKYFDIVIGDELVYHDMQAFVLEQFEPLEKIYYADRRLTALAREAAGGNNVHVGRIATGDQFVSGADEKKDIRARTHALCTEMEGCAVAHTAFLNQVPFLVMRAISDMADGSAETDFVEFQQKAADRAAGIVLELLKSC